MSNDSRFIDLTIEENIPGAEYASGLIIKLGTTNNLILDTHRELKHLRVTLNKSKLTAQELKNLKENEDKIEFFINKHIYCFETVSTEKERIKLLKEYTEEIDASLKLRKFKLSLKYDLDKLARIIPDLHSFVNYDKRSSLYPEQTDTIRNNINFMYDVVSVLDSEMPKEHKLMFIKTSLTVVSLFLKEVTDSWTRKLN